MILGAMKLAQPGDGRRTPMSSKWIVVGSAENLEIARSRGFDMFGFKDKRKRETATMRPGDKLIFYLIGIMKFGGIANIAGEVYEDHSPIFQSEKKPGEDYPFRAATTPDRILTPEQFLDVKEYADKLEMTRARGEYWRLAFQGNLHKISDADYTLLREDIENASKLAGAKA
jgi:predicted RNA-binding protein